MITISEPGQASTSHMLEWHVWQICSLLTFLVPFVHLFLLVITQSALILPKWFYLHMNLFLCFWNNVWQLVDRYNFWSLQYRCLSLYTTPTHASPCSTVYWVGWMSPLTQKSLCCCNTSHTVQVPARSYICFFGMTYKWSHLVSTTLLAYLTMNPSSTNRGKISFSYAYTSLCFSRTFLILTCSWTSGLLEIWDDSNCFSKYRCAWMSRITAGPQGKPVSSVRGNYILQGLEISLYSHQQSQTSSPVFLL